MNRSLCLAVVAALALPAVASAATVTIGSNQLATPTTNFDGANGATSTFGPRAIPGRQVTSPVDGVVTRWRLRGRSDAGVSPITFRVLRPVAATLVPSGTSSTFGLPNVEAVYEQPTRLPIKNNDRIGITHTDLIRGYVSRAGNFAFEAFQTGPAPDGGPAVTPTTLTQFEPLINADVETDADADQFGDDTQDLCVGTPGPEQGCPPPAAAITTPGPVVAPLDRNPPQPNFGSTTVRLAAGGIAPVPVFCPAAETAGCRNVAVGLTGKVATAAARRKTRTVSFGTGTLASIAGGKTATVSVKLPSAALKAFKGKRSVPVSATVAVRDASGNAGTKTSNLVLKPAKKKKKRRG